MRVMGLDLSTSASGVACCCGRTLTIRPQVDASDPYRRLHEIVERLACRVRVEHPDLLIIEEPLRHGPGSTSLFRLAELGAVARTRLFELGLPWVDVHNQRLKRFATGRGNADKEAMKAVAHAAGADCLNDNEADAWLLRAVGLLAYGEDVLDGHGDAGVRLEVVADIDWPVIR